jgi:hypothetical protein
VCVVSRPFAPLFSPSLLFLCLSLWCSGVSDVTLKKKKRKEKGKDTQSVTEQLNCRHAQLMEEKPPKTRHIQAQLGALLDHAELREPLPWSRGGDVRCTAATLELLRTEVTRRIDASHAWLAQQSTGTPAVTVPRWEREDSTDLIPYDAIRLGTKLGQGSFGAVYAAVLAGRPVAVKIALRGNLSTEQSSVESIAAEMALLRKIRGLHTVQYLGVSRAPDGSPVIISELMQGDLEQLFLYDDFRDAIPIERKLRMLRDVAYGLQWLYEVHNVVHHDLKLENILLDEYGRVKICDFGLGRALGRTGIITDGMKAKGAPLFAAPEVLLGKPLDVKIDVWSFGMVMCEIMFEKRVFSQYREF